MIYTTKTIQLNLKIFFKREKIRKSLIRLYDLKTDYADKLEIQ